MKKQIRFLLFACLMLISFYGFSQNTIDQNNNVINASNNQIGSFKFDGSSYQIFDANNNQIGSLIASSGDFTVMNGSNDQIGQLHKNDGGGYDLFDSGNNNVENGVSINKAILFFFFKS